MRELRLQEMVPQVYCNESRDFQVFCRAFDLILNGVKYNVDTIKQITSTKNIRDSILPLLAGKLGFITKENFNSDVLRLMLQGFPDIVKYKGSLKAIKETMYLYMRAIGLDCGVKIWYTEDDYIEDNFKIPNHSIVIGIDGDLKNIIILKEIFKYILPTGINYFFYSYTGITVEEEIALDTIAKWIIVSDEAQAKMRNKHDEIRSVHETSPYARNNWDILYGSNYVRDGECIDGVVVSVSDKSKFRTTFGSMENTNVVFTFNCTNNKGAITWKSKELNSDVQLTDIGISITDTPTGFEPITGDQILINISDSDRIIGGIGALKFYRKSDTSNDGIVAEEYAPVLG